jgi:hypothetical protein
VETVAIPDAACVSAGGTVRVVYPAPAALGFVTLENVGARWLASAREDRGFVLFDADGANASAQPNPLSRNARARATSGGIETFGAVNQGLAFRRYDLQGNAIGDAVLATTDTTATGPNLSPADGGTLLVWGLPFNVYASVVDAQGELDAGAFALEGSSPKSLFRSAVVADGARHAVAWSVRETDDARFRTRFAFFTPGESPTPATTLYGTASPQEVVAIVRSSTGFRVLVHAPPPGPGALLLEVDANGTRIGPARVLVGVTEALGLAAQGDELGVVALRPDKRVAFRPLTSKLEAAGPWVCLDAPATTNPDFTAAIAPDGQGYAVLYRAADDGQSLRRFDKLGTGPL